MNALFRAAAFVFLSAAAAAAEPEFAFKFDLLAGAARQSYLKNSAFNPGNLAFKFSDNYGFGEVRPDGEVRMSWLRAVARPRYRVVFQEEPDAPPGYVGETQLYDFYLKEGYIEVAPTDFFVATIGRQNYQWGPAESFNPSSFFFPELAYRLEPFYEFRGRTMARVNVTAGESWTFVAMAELPSMKDEHLETGNTAEDVYDRNLEFKAEYAWAGAANNVGVIAGRREIDRVENIGGLYAMVTPSDAWQIFADLIATEGSSTLFATGNPAQALAMRKQTGAYVTGVAGARYTFEGGAEWRAEWIFNQNGYTAGEWRDVKTAVASSPIWLTYWNSRQLYPLTGESYFYSSIRKNSQSDWLGFLHQPGLAARVLWSAADQSAFYSASFEGGIGDRGTIYLYGGFALGETDSELRRALDQVGGVAYRLSLW